MEDNEIKGYSPEEIEEAGRAWRRLISKHGVFTGSRAFFPDGHGVREDSDWDYIFPREVYLSNRAITPCMRSLEYHYGSGDSSKQDCDYSFSIQYRGKDYNLIVPMDRIQHEAWVVATESLKFIGREDPRRIVDKRIRVSIFAGICAVYEGAMRPRPVPEDIPF